MKCVQFCDWFLEMSAFLSANIYFTYLLYEIVLRVQTVLNMTSPFKYLPYNTASASMYVCVCACLCRKNQTGNSACCVFFLCTRLEAHSVCPTRWRLSQQQRGCTIHFGWRAAVFSTITWTQYAQGSFPYCATGLSNH